MGFGLFCFVLFWWGVGCLKQVSLYCPAWPGTHWVHQASLKLRDLHLSAETKGVPHHCGQQGICSF